MRHQHLALRNTFHTSLKSSIACLVVSAIVAVVLSCSAALWMPGQAIADDSLTSGSIAAQSGTDTVALGVTATYGQSQARSLLSKVNNFRTGSDTWEWNESDTQKVWHKNLSKLQYDYGLERIAMQRAAEIALNMSHDRPDGCSIENDPDRDGMLENLTKGQKTAEAAFDAWLEADKPYAGQVHRRAMLNDDITHVGMAYALCNGIPCWVQIFSNFPVDTSYVAPDASTRTVSMQVAKSLIMGVTGTPTKSPDSVSVAEGIKADFPVVTAYVNIQSSTEFLRNQPVVVEDLNWKVSDTSVAVAQNGKIKGLKVGTTTATTTVSLKTSTSISVPVEVTENRLKGATVKLSQSSYTYDGKAKEPKVTVVKGGVTLSGSDIVSVKYENNVNVGTATVTVTGKGNYSGVVTSTFTIKKAASKVSLANANATYSGKPIAFKGKVTKTGSQGKVTYTYYKDKNCTKALAASKVKNAGTYYVKAKLSADDNYESATSAPATFKIAKKANSFGVKAVKKTQTAKSKKTTRISAKKAFKVTKNKSRGKVTYNKTSGTSKVKVAKNGTVTIAKGLKKGNSYKIRVKVTAAATANYKAKSAVVTFTVKVK